MYHYKVGVDKQHLKDFVSDFKDRLKETKVKDLLGEQSIEEAISYEELLKEIDKLDTDKAVADAWVDAKTKLFHAIRIADENSNENYFEFGTPYTGGDEYPFTMKFVSTDGTADIKIALNSKTDAVKLTANAQFAGGGSDGTFDLELNLTPRTQAVTIEKPAGAKPLLESLGEFGPLIQQSLDGASSGGIQENAKNTARKSDATMVAVAVAEFMNNNNGKIPVETDLPIIRTTAGPLSQYNNGSQPILATGNQAALTKVTDLRVVTAAKCSVSGATTTTGATARHIAIQYMAEIGGIPTALCLDL